MRLLRKVEATCATLPALGELRTLSELVSRARIVRSALNARSLFEDFHRHMARLGAALADYQARKQQIARRESSTHQPMASSRSSGRPR